jgi:hypothetical protein
VSDRSVRPEPLAGDPVPFAATREQLRKSRRTERELIEAIFEDEQMLGRPHLPSEREAFAKGFFSQEYVVEVRLLAAQWLLDEPDEE